MSLTGPEHLSKQLIYICIWYGITFVSKEKKQWYIVIYHPHITIINKSKSTKASFSFSETFISIK
jgi:hypothetical protein